MRALLSISFILAFGGCTPPFDPASYINKLRLLAVVADPPEVPGGAASTLTAYFANPGGPAPTLAWSECLLPPTPSTGAEINPACAGSDMGAPMVPLPSGATTTMNATLTATTTAPMPTFASPLALGLPDSNNGFYLPIRAVLTAGNQELTAFYRLRFHFPLPAPLLTNPPNKNPVLMGIYRVPSADAGMDQQTELDDAHPPMMTPEVHAHDQVYLRALATPESSEAYVIYDNFPPSGQPRMVNEKIKVSWYTTAGSFSNEATGVAKPDTTLTLDKHLPPSGTPIELWAVAQDERGGTAIEHATLTFR
jgi:hypothetical protein